MWYLPGSERKQENTTSLVSVIKQLCFYRNRKLGMHSEDPAMHVYCNSPGSEPRCHRWHQEAVARAGQSAQAVFRTKAAVKSQGALSEHWQKYLGLITHSILNWPGVYSETVYCSQLSFLPTFTDGAPGGVRLSLRSWGLASTLSKWSACPCEADWHVAVVSMPHTKCQVNLPGDSDRLTLGEQEKGKSACRLELESRGQ